MGVWGDGGKEMDLSDSDVWSTIQGNGLGLCQTVIEISGGFVGSRSLVITQMENRRGSKEV